MIETLTSLALKAGHTLPPVPAPLVRESLENPRTKLDRVFEIMGGSSMTASGIQVGPDTGLQFSAVFAAIRLISTGVAMLDSPIYRLISENEREEIPNHYLYPLLNRQANGDMTAFRFKSIMTQWMLQWGNSYAPFVISPNGRVTSIAPVHPTRVRHLDGGYAVLTDANNWVPVPKDNMLHLRGLVCDANGDGLSVVSQARHTIGAALATEEYGSRMFSNGARMSGFVEVPLQMKADDKARMIKYLEKEYTGSVNAGRVAVFDGGSKFHQTSMSAEDAEFLLSRKFSVNEIARWFGVPPHMIGDLDRATFSNIEHQGLEFTTYSLGPHLENWEAEINGTMLSMTEGKTVFMEFCRDELTRGDMQSRAAAASIFIQNGIMTPNEVREEFELNPHADGNTLLANGTLTPVKILNKKTNPPPGGANAQTGA